MFYTEVQQREYDDAMAQEHMTQGEYMSEALAQYARAHGEAEPEREWILSPYDTWHRNPFYRGPRGRHPEDDFDEEEFEQPVLRTPVSLLDQEFDELPF